MSFMSKKAYAKHRGCTPAAVSRALKDGRIREVTKNGRKGIDSDVADRHWEAKDEPVLAVERARLLKAQADKAEMELAKLRGELVSIEEVSSTVQREYTFVRSGILALPNRMAKLLSMKESAVIYQELTDAVTEILTELTADESYKAQAASE